MREEQGLRSFEAVFPLPHNRPSEPTQKRGSGTVPRKISKCIDL